MKCPKCGSENTKDPKYATKSCGIIGAVAGGISGAAGNVVEFVFSDKKNKGELILAILKGAAGGAVIGGAAGHVADKTILELGYCYSCKQHFGR